VPQADFNDRADCEVADRGLVSSLVPWMIRGAGGAEVWDCNGSGYSYAYLHDQTMRLMDRCCRGMENRRNERSVKRGAHPEYRPDPGLPTVTP
jgi:alkyl sulfatase BDS1-like metallo-beta-lactamase superfamily hydrolase